MSTALVSSWIVNGVGSLMMMVLLFVEERGELFWRLLVYGGGGGWIILFCIRIIELIGRLGGLNRVRHGKYKREP